jgi:hypothetical protein
VVTEIGDGTTVSGGPHPTLWKGVPGNFQTIISLDLEVKKAQDEFDVVESISAQPEGKLEKALWDIDSLTWEVLQLAMMRSDFQDQRTHAGSLESKLVSLASVLGSINVSLQGSSHICSSGDLLDGMPLLDVVNTLNLQVEVIQYRT